MTSARHHQHSIDNFEFVSASSVKTIPELMWRVRVMQGLGVLAVVAFAVRLAQMAGMSFPSFG